MAVFVMVRLLSRETFKLETEVLTKIPGILEITGVVLAAEDWLRISGFIGIQLHISDNRENKHFSSIT